MSNGTRSRMEDSLSNKIWLLRIPSHADGTHQLTYHLPTLYERHLPRHADVFVIVYLDDILIFSKNISKHHNHIRQVLARLWKHHLWVKPKKSIFHSDWVEFLGFIVSGQGVSMDQAKSAAILAWPTPHNIKEVQSFLRFANFYHCFILNFLEIVTPLTCLTCKDIPFEWKDKQQKAFDELKTTFSSTPILTHFNPNDPIVVETDASDYASAAILS